MPVTDKLLPAALNGVPFLWIDVSDTGGRKTIINEYPKSDNRFIEDNGGIKPAYTINCVVSGQDYLQKKINLIRQFDANKDSILSHPYKGPISGRVTGGYTARESLDKVGEVFFTFTFSSTDNKDTQPKPSATSTAEVSNLTDEAEATIVNNVAENYGVVVGGPDGFNDALSVLDDMSESFIGAVLGINTVITELNEYVSGIEAFSRNAVALVSKPIELSVAIEELFERGKGIAENPVSRLEYLQSFYGFGDDSIDFPPTTVQRIEKQKNRDVLISEMKGVSLAQSYASASLIEYETVDALDNVASTIEAQYQVFSELKEVDDTSMQSFANLRAKFREFVDQQRLTAPKVGTININEMPVSILSFNEYGNTDSAQQLVELNGFRDVSFVSGDVNVLTA